jgi:hypothetical protein
MGEEIVWCGKHGEEPHEFMESITDEHDRQAGW